MNVFTFFTQVVFTTNFASMLLRISTPILFAAFGALIFARAGIRNIGLEGVMLFSSLSGVLASAWSGSAFVGILGAVICGVLISLLFGYCVLKLKTPANLCSLALNMLAAGGTIFLLYVCTGEKGSSVSLKSQSVPRIDIPLLQDIPVLGPILSGHNLLTYLAFAAAILVSILVFKTPLGLRMRAVGENPDAASSVGVNVHKIKYIALALSGVLAGLAGGFMSMGYMNWFVRDMTAGRGFIALAAMETGRATPIGTFLSSMLFALMESMSNALQLLNVPSELLRMIPYASTLLSLTIFAIVTASRAKKATQHGKAKKAPQID